MPVPTDHTEPKVQVGSYAEVLGFPLQDGPAHQPTLINSEVLSTALVHPP